MIKRLTFILLICAFLALLPACRSSVPENSAPKVARVILQPIYPPKAGPDSVEVCPIEKNLDRPITEISRVSTRAWSLEEGIHNLKSVAAQLGADAIIRVRHKTQFNVEHSRNIYFVYGDAILWMHGRNSEYLVSDEAPREMKTLTR
jgi:hypothetical protein